MKYIVQAVESRKFYVQQVQMALDDVEVLYDWSGDALAAFISTLEMAVGQAHVHLEDDIILSSNFDADVQKAVDRYPGWVINFFSPTRYEYETQVTEGKKFSCAQAVYLPEGYSTAIIEFAHRKGLDTWRDGQLLDFIIRDFLHERREDYILHHPSLVQHRESESLIDPSRPNKRQARNFADDIA